MSFGRHHTATPDGGLSAATIRKRAVYVSSRPRARGHLSEVLGGRAAVADEVMAGRRASPVVGPSPDHRQGLFAVVVAAAPDHHAAARAGIRLASVVVATRVG